MIGDKYILWIYKHQLDAYKDQFGISHAADVVLEEFYVTVVEEKEVPGMFGSGTYTGIKASDGEKFFTRHWHAFPDDTPTPNYFWDPAKYKGELVQPLDAMQAINLSLFVDKNGERKIPVGISLCDKHKEYFLDTCWKCDVEKELGKEIPW